jgi:protein-L-isoaspartate(D-aspartate) O-methyltransferase
MNSRKDELLAQIRDDFAATASWTGRATVSPRVTAALQAVPREEFVAAADAQQAYINAPLAIGYKQTISQPYIVAIMTELLDLSPEDRVLEIGTGSGYQAAILARLAARVFSIEVIPELASRARETLRRLGYANVELRTGDGNLGWPEEAPFDAIIVTAAAPEVPSALIAQLRPGGRMAVPVGPQGGEQMLYVVEKSQSGEIRKRAALPVAFVPLVKPTMRGA